MISSKKLFGNKLWEPGCNQVYTGVMGAEEGSESMTQFARGLGTGWSGSLISLIS